jgi:hypothetical protein
MWNSGTTGTIPSAYPSLGGSSFSRRSIGTEIKMGNNGMEPTRLEHEGHKGNEADQPVGSRMDGICAAALSPRWAHFPWQGEARRGRPQSFLLKRGSTKAG